MSFVLGTQYRVKIPNCLWIDEPDMNDKWITIASFEDKNRAIEYLQDIFGADKEGNISLIDVIKDN